MQYLLKEITLRHDTVSGFMSIVSSVILSISVTVATVAIKKARVTQKESTSRSLFNDYLKVAMQFPMFGYPKRFKEYFDIVGEKVDYKTLEFERYEWFLSLMIFTMKEILEIHSEDKYWKLTVKRQLSYHVDYFDWLRNRGATRPDGTHVIDENNFVYLAGDQVNELIDIVIDENKQGVITNNIGKNRNNWKDVILKIWKHLWTRKSLNIPL